MNAQQPTHAQDEERRGFYLKALANMPDRAAEIAEEATSDGRFVPFRDEKIAAAVARWIADENSTAHDYETEKNAARAGTKALETLRDMIAKQRDMHTYQTSTDPKIALYRAIVESLTVDNAAEIVDLWHKATKHGQYIALSDAAIDRQIDRLTIAPDRQPYARHLLRRLRATIKAHKAEIARAAREENTDSDPVEPNKLARRYDRAGYNEGPKIEPTAENEETATRDTYDYRGTERRPTREERITRRNAPHSAKNTAKSEPQTPPARLHTDPHAPAYTYTKIDKETVFSTIYAKIETDADGREIARIEVRDVHGRPATYCGRGNGYYGLERSPLANPFELGMPLPNGKIADKPGSTLTAYRRHLWTKIKAGDAATLDALREVARTKSTACHCDNPRTCHTSVIASAAQWLAERDAAQMREDAHRHALATAKASAYPATAKIGSPATEEPQRWQPTTEDARNAARA